MGQKQPDIPKAPDPAQTYKQGIQLQLKYLPKQVQQELMLRYQYDPQFLNQALGLQAQYDPWLAGEQQAAVYRRDPEWAATHGLLGQQVYGALQRGYLGGAAVDPRYEQAYGALARDVTGQVARGSTASPDTLRNMTQAILARQPSLSSGEAQNMAAAVYTGQRGEQLRQQRQQATGQFLGLTDPTRLGQAAQLQSLGVGGTYLSSPTMTSQINQTQGVTPPRQFGYVNPYAGLQGQQYRLQNYQNQLGYAQVQGGGGNPWMNALQGAGSGAMAGTTMGGFPYGTIIGAGIGAAGGYFSDVRLKENISRTGTTTKDGIPIVEFNYKGDTKRYRGVLAQDVERVRPDAVGEFLGVLTVNYRILGLNLEEI